MFVDQTHKATTTGGVGTTTARANQTARARERERGSQTRLFIPSHIHRTGPRPSLARAVSGLARPAIGAMVFLYSIHISYQLSYRNILIYHHQRAMTQHCTNLTGHCTVQLLLPELAQHAHTPGHDSLCHCPFYARLFLLFYMSLQSHNISLFVP